ncbi:MAG: methionine adenosyltransferase [Deltaproteobacteria bacterium]|nr:methionine adenosyltransferase [Deltaproteobacteria bacterium]
MPGRPPKVPNISIEIERSIPVSGQAVEIVERKGLGHPDYICDAVMERISVALSREYIKTFGTVLHHNIDKGLLVAGETEKDFGGGKIIKPMELIIGDRATFFAGRTRVPVADIARETVRDWFKENLPRVEIKKDLKISVVLKPGSAELSDIFLRRGKVKAANDTSASVGYAPFTDTEKAVYDLERFINSPAFKLSFPESGEDVKVMGIRRGGDLDLTVACPLVAGLIKSEQDYFKRKRAIYGALKEFLKDVPFRNVTLNFNTLDVRNHGKGGVYLTLLGTSAEDADSGQVGRGNRVNGVISLNRPMGTEAAAGKNPVSHAGKIYTILAHQMANELYRRVKGIKEVYVWLLSQIGSPIDEPKQVYVRIIPGRSIDLKSVNRNVGQILEELLSGIIAFTGELSRGEHPVC